MRVVIHVGAHKTGTSLVQKYFRDNSTLTAELGVAYVGRTDTNRLIGWGNRVVDRPELLRGRIDTELAARPSAVFISHENTLGRPFAPDRPGLYPDAPALAEELAKLCDGLDTYVVFYIRSVADFVESYYLQTIHQGASHTFDEWYETLDPASLMWTPTIDALSAAFGADRVVLGDFAEIAEGQDEFLRRFIRRAGLPMPATVEYKPVRNASISARGLQIALGINRHLRNDKERQATRKFLQANFSNRREERAAPMPDQVRAHLAEQSAEEARALAARAAAALESPVPPPPGPGRVPLPRLIHRGSALSASKRLVNRVRGRR